MGDEHDRPALLLEREDPPEALSLERLVADGEDLVQQQDVGVEERRDREPEPHRHSRRVRADGPIDRVLELGECDDLVEAALDLGPCQTLDRAVQEDVLAPGEVHVKAGAELEQRANASLSAYATRRRLDDPGDESQQRGLARSVASDQADGLAVLDGDRDIAQCPHVTRGGLSALHNEILQRPRLSSVHAKAPRDTLDVDLADLHAT